MGAHPDDLNLDDEPTLFEQVISGNADTDSDTDDTSRDGDVTNCDAEVGDSLDDAVLTVAERRRRRARIQRKTKQGPAMCGLNSLRTREQHTCPPKDKVVA